MASRECGEGGEWDEVEGMECNNASETALILSNISEVCVYVVAELDCNAPEDTSVFTVLYSLCSVLCLYSVSCRHQTLRVWPLISPLPSPHPPPPQLLSHWTKWKWFSISLSNCSASLEPASWCVCVCRFSCVNGAI